MSDDDHRRSKPQSQERLFFAAKDAWSDAVVPNIVNGNGKAVALFLLSRANFDDFKTLGVLRSWPGQKTMAKKLGLSVRGIKRHLQNMRKIGALRAQRRGREQSRYDLVKPSSHTHDEQKIIDFEARKNGSSRGQSSVPTKDRFEGTVRCPPLPQFEGTLPQFEGTLRALRGDSQVSPKIEEIEFLKGKRAAQVARLVPGATFAALPFDHESLLRAVVVDHFNGRLPPWLAESNTTDGSLEAAMLTENQLLRALAHERGLAKNFPEMFQVFENDNEMLERLLDMNDGGRRVISTTLARTTEAAACREARNLTDGDPAPELSEAECEAVERVAMLCGVDVATQLLVQFCLIK